MNKTAWVFPGQGSQFAGMGKDLYGTFSESKNIFDNVDDVLGFKITDLCFMGPIRKLSETINTQPAIFAVSIACLKAFESKINYRPSFVAGHSLGEYTALVATGVIDFIDALKLVRERGRLMQEAPQNSKEGMAAIIGFDRTTIEELCANIRNEYSDYIIQVANYNSPKQIVLSGDIDALKIAMKKAEENGAKLASLLNVNRAFHSEMMLPAAKKLESTIMSMDFHDANIPIVSDGKALNESNEIKSYLVKQLTSPVKWVNSVEYMIESGVDRFIEIGPGKVLTGLIKHTNNNVDLLNLGDAKSIMSYIEGEKK